MLKRVVASIAVLLIGCGLLAACSEDPEPSQPDSPRALKLVEAEAMAVTRFNAYRDEVLSFDAELAGATTWKLEVQVDLAQHTGHGRFTTLEAGEQIDQGFLTWNQSKLYTASGAGEVPAASEWWGRDLGTDSYLDIFLALLLQLGADRPENPQLLQQSTAEFQREDSVGDDEVWVITGPRETAEGDGAASPSRTRYWITPEGALRRFEVRLDLSVDDWTRATTVAEIDDFEVPAEVQTLLQKVGA